MLRSRRISSLNASAEDVVVDDDDDVGADADNGADDAGLSIAKAAEMSPAPLSPLSKRDGGGTVAR